MGTHSLPATVGADLYHASMWDENDLGPAPSPFRVLVATYKRFVNTPTLTLLQKPDFPVDMCIFNFNKSVFYQRLHLS